MMTLPSLTQFRMNSSGSSRGSTSSLVALFWRYRRKPSWISNCISGVQRESRVWGVGQESGTVSARRFPSFVGVEEIKVEPASTAGRDGGVAGGVNGRGWKVGGGGVMRRDLRTGDAM